MRDLALAAAARTAGIVGQRGLVVQEVADGGGTVLGVLLRVEDVFVPEHIHSRIRRRTLLTGLEQELAVSRFGCFGLRLRPTQLAHQRLPDHTEVQVLDSVLNR